MGLTARRGMRPGNVAPDAWNPWLKACIALLLATSMLKGIRQAEKNPLMASLDSSNARTC